MTLDNIPRFNLYANSNLVEQPFGILVYYTDVMAVVEKLEAEIDELNFQLRMSGGRPVGAFG